MPVYPACALLARVLASNFSRRPRLYKLNLFVTYRCNFHCLACAIWKKPQSQEMDLGEYERLFSRLDLNWIDVSGGEISMRADILDIFGLIIQSQKNLMLLHFPTNGFFTERIVETAAYILARTRARLVVTVSLDGPAFLHDSLREEGSWDRCVRTYRQLKRLSASSGGRLLEVFFGYTISDHNYTALSQTLAELKKYVPAIGWQDMHINLAHQSAHYYGNLSFGINKSFLLQSLEEHIARRHWRLTNPFDYLERRYHVLARRYLKCGRTPLPCRSLINNLFLDPCGYVYPCTIYSAAIACIKDYDYDLGKVLSSDIAGAVRQNIAEGKCPQCWSPCEAYPMILSSLAHPVPATQGA